MVQYDLSMTRTRVRRYRSGDLKDSTKEMLVISFLLGEENTPSSASSIWNAWNPKNPDAAGVVASQDGRALSLTGTIKVCTRLVDEGILVSISEKGYNDRNIKSYRFPAKGDRSYKDGFLRVAERTRNSPFLLMDSEYGRSGIKDVLMTKAEKDLDMDLGPWKGVVAWAAARSPTVLMLICDRDLSAGAVSGVSDCVQRLRKFLAAVGGAVTADRVSGYRGRHLNKDEQTDMVELLLATGAASAGKEDETCLKRLKKFEVT
jgi:hypothetical protein